MTSDMRVRFWGVRGSAPVPGPTTLRYGGNTACVEVRCGTALVILDAGTGLRELGKALAQEEGPVDADLFVSHPHLDHLIGLPFFSPFYRAGNHLRLWHPAEPGPTRPADFVSPLINPPYHPVPVDQMAARISRQPFKTGETLHPLDTLRVQTIALDHPGGSTGYRLDYEGRSVVYLTDMELGPQKAETIAGFAARADLLICDAMFQDSEKKAHAGWGHTTWQDAVELARQAAVARLVLFHHAPDRTDKALDEIERQAAILLPGTEVAAEGMSLRL